MQRRSQRVAKPLFTIASVGHAFAARRAWRCWSRGDPTVHIAFYEFDSVEEAEAATAPEQIQPLVADFDRVWGDRVKRRREILEVAQEIVP